MAIPVCHVYIAWGALPGDGIPPSGSWFLMDAYVKSVSTRRGRSDVLDRIEAGTATIVLDNSTAYFTPTNTASPYYPGVRPFAQVKILADAVSVWYGFIERITPQWEKVSGGTVTLECTDAFRYLSFADLTSEPCLLDSCHLNVDHHILYEAGAFPEQTVGARVAAVLGSIGNPFTEDVDTAGGATVTTASVTDNALDYLRSLVTQEQGLFYQAPDGQITFDALDTIRAAATWTTSQATIGDGVGEIPYTDLSMSMSEELVLNEISGQISGGTQIATQSNTTSQQTYMQRSYDYGTTEFKTAAELEKRAQILLVERREAKLKADVIAFCLSDSAVDAATLLGLGFQHRVTLKRTPSAGDALSDEYLVQGIEHDIVPGLWTMRLRVSMSPDLWKLGVDELGIGTVL